MAMKGYQLPHEVPWNDIEKGAIVTEPGSASFKKTGDWRTERPYIDKGTCIRCGLCWLHCPDAAINEVDEGYFEVDFYHCKGCGICASICPVNAISMSEEVEQ